MPKDKPSIGDGNEKKQPSWWEEGASNRNTTTPLFIKKREEMKNPPCETCCDAGQMTKIQMRRKWKRKAKEEQYPEQRHIVHHPRNYGLNRICPKGKMVGILRRQKASYFQTLVMVVASENKSIQNEGIKVISFVSLYATVVVINISLHA